MARSALARALCLVAAAGLSSCVATGTVDKRVARLNNSLSSAQNTAILLNVVRAAHAEPLFFTNVSHVGGSASQNVGLSLPSVSFGPDRVATQRNYTIGGPSLDGATNMNFDLNSLGSKDFYAGLLAPLDLVDVNLLLHQGFSRELVFYLVVDRATVQIGDDIAVYTNNPRNAEQYAVFEKYMGEAIIHGITTRAFLSGGKPQGELCYDRTLARADLRDGLKSSPHRCDSPTSPARGDAEAGEGAVAVELNGQRQIITISTRSIFGIFSYLGEMMTSGLGEQVVLHDYQLPVETVDKSALLSIRKHGFGCFVKASYEGDTYCVPQKGSENTKRIFSILSALLALKTSPGDLPVTQTVRITP